MGRAQEAVNKRKGCAAQLHSAAKSGKQEDPSLDLHYPGCFYLDFSLYVIPLIGCFSSELNMKKANTDLKKKEILKFSNSISATAIINNRLDG